MILAVVCLSCLCVVVIVVFSVLVVCCACGYVCRWCKLQQFLKQILFQFAAF